MTHPVLTHYEILQQIGSGGSGSVYLARDLRLGRKVALKLLNRPGPGLERRLKRFEREARSLATLNHPGVVSIHSIEEDHGRCFITMEWVRGQRLTDAIPEGGFDLGTFYDVAISLAEALRATHRAGIVHRDLKPDNVMVQNVMVQGRQAKILDFGLAKLAEDAEQLTETGKLVGTVPYMAPEQLLDHKITAAADTFNLGLLLHKMLTGRLPFERRGRGRDVRAIENWGTAVAILEQAPIPATEVREDVPRHLADLILQCLEKDPRHRPTTAEIAARLAELREEHLSATSWLVRFWQRFAGGPTSRNEPASVSGAAW